MTASYNLELLYLHLQPNYNQFNYSTMAKITKEAALLYHSQGKPGKIEVVPTKPYSTQTDLSLAYSPGVAEPCLEIEKNPQDAYKYTAKGNLVAVISNGTAVLGLGDIGALSGKPVMEGKGLLFKIYAGIDVFDIEVNEKDPDKFIEAVKAIGPNIRRYQLGRHQSTRMFRNRTPPERRIGHPRDARRPARHRHHLQRRIAERPGSGRQEDRGSENRRKRCRGFRHLMYQTV